MVECKNKQAHNILRYRSWFMCKGSSGNVELTKPKIPDFESDDEENENQDKTH